MQINVSKGKLYYSQRNNERDPNNTCNVTSMIMALYYLGFNFPSGKYTQPEDNLHLFMTERKLRPWIHAELSLAVNQWIGKQITSFSTARTISSIFDQLKDGRPVVLSGTFPGFPTKLAKPLGHIVTLVGAEWDEVTVNPKSIIIDDPYGDTLNNWKGSGNDIVLSWAQFIDWFKDCGSTQTKWGHFFKKPEEV
ncbi:MAG: C39 family peptidase [Treponema sp.]|nr:C39 family peptidase [Treponema sp.]